MSTETIELSTVIAAEPDDAYAAWMTAKRHAAFTGAAAAVEARAGARHAAWGGYIHGWVLKAGPGRRATFAWRTTDFTPADPDSLVELSMTRAKGGTLVKITHRDVPAGQGARYMQGWEEYYFEPLARYFAASKPKKKTAAKKRAP